MLNVRAIVNAPSMDASFSSATSARPADAPRPVQLEFKVTLPVRPEFDGDGVTARAPAPRILFYCIARSTLLPHPSLVDAVCHDSGAFARMCQENFDAPRPDFVTGMVRVSAPQTPASSPAAHHQHRNSHSAAPAGLGGSGMTPVGRNTTATGSSSSTQQQEQHHRHPQQGGRKHNVNGGEVPATGGMVDCAFVGRTAIAAVDALREQMLSALDGSDDPNGGLLLLCTVLEGGAAGMSKRQRVEHAAPPMLRASGSPLRAVPFGPEPGTPQYRAMVRRRDAQRAAATSDASRAATALPSLRDAASAVFCLPFSADTVDVADDAPDSRDATTTAHGSDLALSRSECAALQRREYLERGRPRRPYHQARRLAGSHFRVTTPEGMRRMAVHFTRFLVRATQDTQRYCSLQASRLLVPLVLLGGMRTPQVDAFNQFLAEARRIAALDPVPGLDHISTSPPSPSCVRLATTAVSTHDNRAAAAAGHNMISSTADGGHGDDTHRHHHGNAKRVLVPVPPLEPMHLLEALTALSLHCTDDYADRSVYTTWVVDWFDYLLLCAVEAPLWRYLRILIERLFERSEDALLHHPDVEQLAEEEALRRVVDSLKEEEQYRLHQEQQQQQTQHANGGDEMSGGASQQIHNGGGIPPLGPWQIQANFDSSPKAIRPECARAWLDFTSKSTMHLAFVRRLRHMTQQPYIQALLFDPTFSAFAELCARPVRFTPGLALWATVMPLRSQHMAVALTALGNGLPLLTTRRVAERQFRSFLRCTFVGEEALGALCLASLRRWIAFARERRLRRRQIAALGAAVKRQLVAADQRRVAYLRWLTVAKRRRNNRDFQVQPPQQGSIAGAPVIFTE